MTPTGNISVFHTFQVVECDFFLLLFCLKRKTIKIQHFKQEHMSLKAASFDFAAYKTELPE